MVKRSALRLEDLELYPQKPPDSRHAGQRTGCSSLCRDSSTAPIHARRRLRGFTFRSTSRTSSNVRTNRSNSYSCW